MVAKRLFQTLKLWSLRGSKARMDYLREKQVFAAVGEGSTIMDRRVPLYANLIKIGRNVHLASNVRFITHDATNAMLNNMNISSKNLGGGFREIVGCIEIGDNVFVGANVTILNDVRIGSNVIIGACSVVTKDVKDNTVVAGVPAREICSFESYVSRRNKACSYPEKLQPRNQVVGKELEDWLWADFYMRRGARPE